MTCTGEHHYFVADKATYRGTIFILLVCTACGEPKKVEFVIAPGDAELTIE